MCIIKCILVSTVLVKMLTWANVTVVCVKPAVSVNLYLLPLLKRCQEPSLFVQRRIFMYKLLLTEIIRDQVFILG